MSSVKVSSDKDNETTPLSRSNHQLGSRPNFLGFGGGNNSNISNNNNCGSGNKKRNTKARSRSTVGVAGEVSVSFSSSQLSSSTSELSLDEFKSNVEYSTSLFQKQQTELDDKIQEQVTLAVARQQMGNDKGAVLTMKKVKKLQHERQKLDQALILLHDHLQEFQNTTDGSENSSLSPSPSFASPSVNFLETHKAYAKKVSDIMEQPAPQTCDLEDEELLQELAALSLLTSETTTTTLSSSASPVTAEGEAMGTMTTI